MRLTCKLISSCVAGISVCNAKLELGLRATFKLRTGQGHINSPNVFLGDSPYCDLTWKSKKSVSPHTRGVQNALGEDDV